MFSHKETDILKALIEEELTHVLNYMKQGDPLFVEYHSSLTSLLLKIKIDDFSHFRDEYAGLIDSDIMKRQAA